MKKVIASLRYLFPTVLNWDSLCLFVQLTCLGKTFCKMSKFSWETNGEVQLGRWPTSSLSIYLAVLVGALLWPRGHQLWPHSPSVVCCCPPTALTQRSQGLMGQQWRWKCNSSLGPVCSRRPLCSAVIKQPSSAPRPPPRHLAVCCPLGDAPPWLDVFSLFQSLAQYLFILFSVPSPLLSLS